MHKGFLRWGAMLGALSVALGAFAAHGLKKFVEQETVNTFETGVRYQFYHVFALILVSLLYEKSPTKLLSWSGYSFLTGILLFSGSLYALTAMKATGTVGLSGIGIITPFGGLFFILGWVLMFINFVRK